MDNKKILLSIAVLAVVSIVNTATVSAGEYPYPNLAGDANFINFADFAVLAENWLKTGSGLAGDFDDSGLVDYNDLETLCDYWLKDLSPEGIFESFKAALAIGDVNEALTYVSEISREKYAEIFQTLGANLPDYAAGMGGLILESQEEGKAKYGMIHQVGVETYLFPVIFMKDEQGSWKIYNF